MKVLTLIALALLFIISSCSNKVLHTLDGWWTIDTLIYKNHGEIRTCVSINSLWFHKHDLDLPTSENYCEGIPFISSKKGDWSVIRTDSIPLLLKIESKNPIFNGTHRMVFRRDDANKLLKMELSSDSLYVVCRKGLFCYDCEQSLVNELVEMSNKKK